MLVISCHADTGFTAHALEDCGDGVVRGHLDNFAGVHAVMQAFFSGRLNHDFLRVELTHGEEEGLAGAYELLRYLRRHDVVLVVDVTGAPTAKDFVVEKCRDATMRELIETALDGLVYDLYEGCQDPIASEDEVDVYLRRCPMVCALSIPCFGGDYNAEPVRCRRRSIEQATEAICRIAGRFPAFAEHHGICCT